LFDLRSGHLRLEGDGINNGNNTREIADCSFGGIPLKVPSDLTFEGDQFN